MASPLEHELQLMTPAQWREQTFDGKEYGKYAWRIVGLLDGERWCALFFAPMTPPLTQGPWTNPIDAYLAVDAWCEAQNLPVPVAS